MYRETRRLLVDELGIEPSPALRELEAAILRQDEALAPGGEAATRERTILVIADTPERIDELLAIAEPLARRPPRKLILALLLRRRTPTSPRRTPSSRSDGTPSQRKASPARVAAFTTAEPGADAVRLASEHDVDLTLLHTSPQLLEEGRLDRDLETILQEAPCDVAMLVGSGDVAAGPVVAPFGGVEHDWSAIEVAAWLAGSLGTTLRLLGTEADSAAWTPRREPAAGASLADGAAGGRDRHGAGSHSRGRARRTCGSTRLRPARRRALGALADRRTRARARRCRRGRERADALRPAGSPARRAWLRTRR